MPGVKRPRIEADDEDETPVWREENLFKGENCFKIGSLWVRCFFNTVRFAWFIFWKKKLLFNEASSSGMKDGQFMSPISDVQFVAKSIRKIVQDLLLLPTKGFTARDMYKDTPESYKTTEFRHKSFCKQNESRSIILRGFTDTNGSISVRILTPKNSRDHPHWLGNSCTVDICFKLSPHTLLFSI